MMLKKYEEIIFHTRFYKSSKSPYTVSEMMLEIVLTIFLVI